MKLFLRQFFQNAKGEDGTTTVEYAIMIALILVFCIAALLSTGDVQQQLWFNTADKMQALPL